MPSLHEVQSEFEAVVPFGEAAFMVLKAHLLAEHHLFGYVCSRVTDPGFEKQMKSPYSPVGSGLGLILLAQALSYRDQVPPTNSAVLWPALTKLNELRNRLAHELYPDPKKIEKKMREFIKLASGSALDDHESANQLFYPAAQLIVAYLEMDQIPLSIEDTV